MCKNLEQSYCIFWDILYPEKENGSKIQEKFPVWRKYRISCIGRFQRTYDVAHCDKLQSRKKTISTVGLDLQNAFGTF